jgi:hypothetical protein
MADMHRSVEFPAIRTSIEPDAVARADEEATLLVLENDVLPLPSDGEQGIGGIITVPGVPVIWDEPFRHVEPFREGTSSVPLRRVRMPVGWKKVSDERGLIDILNEFDRPVGRAFVMAGPAIAEGSTEMMMSPPATALLPLAGIRADLEDRRTKRDRLEREYRELLEAGGEYGEEGRRKSLEAGDAGNRCTAVEKKYHAQILARGVDAAAQPAGTYPALEKLIGPADSAPIAYSWVYAAGKIAEYCDTYDRDPSVLRDPRHRPAGDDERTSLRELNDGLARARFSLEMSEELEASVLPAVRSTASGGAEVPFR